MSKDIFIEKFEQDVKKRPRWLRLLLALDQFFNVLLWNGSQDETISSHVGRRIESGKANFFDKLVCRVLNKLDSEHCKESKGE